MSLCQANITDHLPLGPWHVGKPQPRCHQTQNTGQPQQRGDKQIQMFKYIIQTKTMLLIEKSLTVKVQ